MSLVNNGYKKSETVTHMLPGTGQEFRKSTESNSTMESEYSLSILEIDLFDDMRASMRKSCKASDLLESSSKFQSQTGIPNPHCTYLLLSTINHVELNGGQSFSNLQLNLFYCRFDCKVMHVTYVTWTLGVG